MNKKLRRAMESELKNRGRGNNKDRKKEKKRDIWISDGMKGY